MTRQERLREGRGDGVETRRTDTGRWKGGGGEVTGKQRNVEKDGWKDEGMPLALEYDLVFTLRCVLLTVVSSM